MLIQGSPLALTPPRAPSMGGLGSYIDDVVARTGGLQPGESLSFEDAVYMMTGGNPQPYQTQATFATWGAMAYGSVQGFIDYFSAIAQRATAQKIADDAYAAYTAARIEAAPQAAALLDFDANGRATDESVAIANAYQNVTAPAVAEAAADLEAARDNYAQTVQAIQAQAQATAAAALPPAFTDAELVRKIDEQFQAGSMPGQVEAYLVRDLGVSLSRASALINAQFTLRQAQTQAVQTAQAQAQTVAGVSIPAGITGWTATAKAAWYRAQREAGYSDATIRTAAQAALGAIPDADWAYLVRLAYPVRVDPANPQPSGVAGGNAALTVLALAAAFLLR